MQHKRHLPEGIKDRVRELRRNATEAEDVLWKVVRNRGLEGAKFRRQHPVGGFVLDFYCEEARLGIELDGGSHRGAPASQRDQERSRILAEQHGIQVIRLWNSDVVSNTANVVSLLRERLQHRLSESPTAEQPGA